MITILRDRNGEIAIEQQPIAPPPEILRMIKNIAGFITDKDQLTFAKRHGITVSTFRLISFCMVWDIEMALYEEEV